MSRVAEERVDVERDVVYGVVAGESLLLDAYRSLPHGEPRPAVVLIHGGVMGPVAAQTWSTRPSSVELADTGHNDVAWAQVGPPTLDFLGLHLRPQKVRQRMQAPRPELRN